jgi:hypothetical protein
MTEVDLGIVRSNRLAREDTGSSPYSVRKIFYEYETYLPTRKFILDDIIRLGLHWDWV